MYNFKLNQTTYKSLSSTWVNVDICFFVLFHPLKYVGQSVVFLDGGLVGGLFFWFVCCGMVSGMWLRLSLSLRMEFYVKEEKVK